MIDQSQIPFGERQKNAASVIMRYAQFRSFGGSQKKQGKLIIYQLFTQQS